MLAVPFNETILLNIRYTRTLQVIALEKEQRCAQFQKIKFSE